MKLALLLLVSAARPALGAEPGGQSSPDAGVVAQIWQLDAPFQVVQDGDVLLELDAGVVMGLKTFGAVDQEFVRLQKLEYEHNNEPTPQIWFAAGTVLGGIATAGLLIGLWFVTK